MSSKQTLATGLVTTLEVTVTNLPFYRDPIPMGHYVIIRSVAGGYWRYYPTWQELKHNGITYQLTDGIYQFARKQGTTRKERQALADKLLLDILTWHEHVSCVGPCSCGKQAALMIDPYHMDINERIVYDYQCVDCYKQSCEDI
jgi:hypothetical protein